MLNVEHLTQVLIYSVLIESNNKVSCPSVKRWFVSQGNYISYNQSRNAQTSKGAGPSTYQTISSSRMSVTRFMTNSNVSSTVKIFFANVFKESNSRTKVLSVFKYVAWNKSLTANIDIHNFAIKAWFATIKWQLHSLSLSNRKCLE